MQKTFLEYLQKTTVQILRNPLDKHAKDNCSELSRYLGYIALEKDSSLNAFIFKIKLTGSFFHDILILNENELWFALDPTVWQLFPDEKSIIVCSGKNKKELMRLLKYRYKYESIFESEQLYQKDNYRKNKLLKTIKKNIIDIK
jgi:hypothetical protein